MNTPVTAVERSVRRHDIDALRVIAFGLLILYHVGMFYVADWGWHVKSSHLSETLQWPMLVVNQWRMALIFLISGLALSFVADRYRPSQLAGRRSWRLLWPLLFGMAIVVPPQAYYQALSNGVIEPGYADFLVRYFTFQPWPEGAFDGSHIGITWNHLWYLPYLLAYTLLLAALLPALRSRAGQAVLTRLRSLRGVWLVVLPTLPLLFHGLVIYPLFGDISHDFFTDGYAHALYFTIFLYGFIIGRDERLWTSIGNLRWPLLCLAPLTFIGYRLLVDATSDDASPVQWLSLFCALYLNRWVWLLLLLGWSYRLLNRPWRWLPAANRAVYPWYILHQTITVVAGYHLARMGLGPVWEPLLVLLATVLGCWLIYRWLILPVHWLRPCFGVWEKVPANTRAQRAAAADHTSNRTQHQPG
ncbi:MAG: acyltransferase [Lysobacterales bacterium]